MKRLYQYLIFAPLLTIWACNEKVSPELQGANSTTPENEIVELPEEYYFKITDESPTLLNYKLHKTGPTNANKECSIKKNEALTNDEYKTGTPESGLDISCFMEAEELSLHHGGMSFGIYASKNTCDYVAYSPFSFYNRIPGNSTTTILKVNCPETISSIDPTTLLQITNTLTGINPIFSSTASMGALGCTNKYLDLNLESNERAAFSVEEDEHLCRFNYLDGDEEKCDIGTITLHEIDLTLEENVITVGTPTTTTINCGGKHYNCIRGPIKEIADNKSRITEILATERNKDFSKEYELPAPVEKGIPNYEYVNFRRHLASTKIDFGTSAVLDEAVYKTEFTDKRDFDPDILDRYSNNKQLDGSDLIKLADAIDVDDSWVDFSYVYSIPGNTGSAKLQNAKPLAAEPYIGDEGYRTNPFYTFYCLDNALEIKARIRVMVRDWDRVFSSSDLTLISDIGETEPRQDNRGIEISEDQDPFNDFNDFDDWDDFLHMETVVSDPDVNYFVKPIKGPNDDSAYENFFNPNIFPNFVEEAGD